MRRVLYWWQLEVNKKKVGSKENPSVRLLESFATIQHVSPLPPYIFFSRLASEGMDKNMVCAHNKIDALTAAKCQINQSEGRVYASIDNNAS